MSHCSSTPLTIAILGAFPQRSSQFANLIEMAVRAALVFIVDRFALLAFDATGRNVSHFEVASVGNHDMGTKINSKIAAARLMFSRLDHGPLWNTAVAFAVRQRKGDVGIGDKMRPLASRSGSA